MLVADELTMRAVAIVSTLGSRRPNSFFSRRFSYAMARARSSCCFSSATCFFSRAFSLRTPKKLPIAPGTETIAFHTDPAAQLTGAVTSAVPARSAEKAAGLNVDSASRTAPTSAPATAIT